MAAARASCGRGGGDRPRSGREEARGDEASMPSRHVGAPSSATAPCAGYFQRGSACNIGRRSPGAWLVLARSSARTTRSHRKGEPTQINGPVLVAGDGASSHDTMKLRQGDRPSLRQQPSRHFIWIEGVAQIGESPACRRRRNSPTPPTPRRPTIVLEEISRARRWSASRGAALVDRFLVVDRLGGVGYAGVPVRGR